MMNKLAGPLWASTLAWMPRLHGRFKQARPQGAASHTVSMWTILKFSCCAVTSLRQEPVIVKDLRGHGLKMRKEEKGGLIGFLDISVSIFCYACIDSFSHSLFHSLTRSLHHSLHHPLLRALTHSLTHSFTH